MSEPPAIEGVSHRTVRARGLDFHLGEAGSGEDVVLCLHGWPQHWYEWRRVLPALGERQRVLAMDLRGFGWSDAPPSGYEKENLADDVITVLDQLDLDRVKLIGHDWGGWIGFLLALRAPERLERFLALGIVPPWIRARNSLPHAWRFAYQLPLATPGIGERLQQRPEFLQRVFAGASTIRDPWDEETVRIFADNLAEPARAAAGSLLYRTFLLREMPALLRGRYAGQRLSVPTRLVSGSDDPAIAAGLLDGCERQGDDLEVEVVEGCGHFIVDEMPELVIERARSFLA